MIGDGTSDERCDGLTEQPIVAAVIEDEAPIWTWMKACLEDLGWECRVATDGNQGLDLIRDEDPDIVFLDIRMPGMNGLDVLRELQHEAVDPIVVVMTAYGTEDTAAEALRLRADDYLKKPFGIPELRRTADKYTPIMRARRAPTELPDFVVDKICDVRIGNDLDLVYPVAHYLAREAEMSRRYELGHRCSLGLFELIANAIEHGNLGISGAEKRRCLEAGGDAWTRLVMARRFQPPYSDRQVWVRLVSTRDYAEWTVEDEGDGFDWQAMMAVLKQSSLSMVELHGRGIYLAYVAFHELEYQGRGNRVRARRYKDGRPLSSQHGENP